MTDQKLNGLSKGLQVLQKFVFGKEAWGPREIARELGLSKSTALRMLQTLADAGFLALNEKEGKYRVGPEALAAGGRVEKPRQSGDDHNPRPREVREGGG